MYNVQMFVCFIYKCDRNYALMKAIFRSVFFLYIITYF